MYLSYFAVCRSWKRADELERKCFGSARPFAALSMNERVWCPMFIHAMLYNLLLRPAKPLGMPWRLGQWLPRNERPSVLRLEHVVLQTNPDASVLVSALFDVDSGLVAEGEAVEKLHFGRARIEVGILVLRRSERVSKQG